MWIMNAKSESGDNYSACAKWDHEPSREEQDKVRVRLDRGEELDCEFNPNEPFQAKVDGKVYECYITWWEVKEI